MTSIRITRKCVIARVYGVHQCVQSRVRSASRGTAAHSHSSCSRRSQAVEQLRLLGLEFGLRDGTRFQQLLEPHDPFLNGQRRGNVGGF